MFRCIALLKKFYTLKSQHIIGCFLYGQDITFSKFADCRYNILNHFFAMHSFWCQGNIYVSIKSIGHTVYSIECESLSTFDFGNCGTSHTHSFSDLCLGHSQLDSPLPEKLPDIIKFIHHRKNLLSICKDIKCFLNMKH